MDDTKPEAAAVVHRAIERRAPAQRMRDALALSETVRALGIAELRRRYPHDSMRALVERMTGEPIQCGSRAGPRADA